jgi:hypothetical protein
MCLLDPLRARELATQNAQNGCPTHLSYLGVVLSLTLGFGEIERPVDRH